MSNKNTQKLGNPYKPTMNFISSEGQSIQVEPNLTLIFANFISKCMRRIKYYQRIILGTKKTKIVSEGDSWFQFPFKINDIIDYFINEKDFAVYSLGAGGDLVAQMAREKEYIKALKKTQANILLLSGGGNDLFGQGRFEHLLLPYQTGKTAKDVVNTAVLNKNCQEVVEQFSIILDDVYQYDPSVKVFGHSYDVGMPIKGEKYFGLPLEKANIPEDLWRDVMLEIFYYFKDQLQGLEYKFSNYHFVNLLETAGNDQKFWHDEIHPNNEGFEAVAHVMISAVREHISNDQPD